MGRLWIKICGIRDEEAARAAVAAGADALGFVFAPSPRRVDPDRARRIAASVGAGRAGDGAPGSGSGRRVAAVGVFVNAPVDEMVAIARQVGLTHVQLHGDESEETVVALQAAGLLVIRAVAVPARDTPPASSPVPGPALTTAADLVLVDTYVPGQRGGTGRPGDWAAAAALARRRAVILAGGLTPGNVARAVAAARPWGVDVSSGVERARGVKDPGLIARFVHAARQAEAAAGSGTRRAGAGGPAGR